MLRWEIFLTFILTMFYFLLRKRNWMSNTKYRFWLFGMTFTIQIKGSFLFPKRKTFPAEDNWKSKCLNSLFNFNSPEVSWWSQTVRMSDQRWVTPRWRVSALYQTADRPSKSCSRSAFLKPVRPTVVWPFQYQHHKFFP